MLLVVDAGNTNIVMGLYDDSEVARATLRIGTRHDTTADEISILVHHLARDASGGVKSIERTVLCSVVPRLTPALVEFVTAELGHDPILVSAEMDLEIPLAVDRPAEVGADRIVNALAARELVGAPAIVVDLGTTTNFDCLDPEGNYAGGVLVPGVETSAEELFRRAARLSKVDLTCPPRVVGRNTRDALRSGILFGAAGMIDALVPRIFEELGGVGKTIATGGLAQLIGPRCASIDRIEGNLTLHGLVLVDRLQRTRSV